MRLASHGFFKEKMKYDFVIFGLFLYFPFAEKVFFKLSKTNGIRFYRRTATFV
jgi:hypothetical protein